MLTLKQYREFVSNARFLVTIEKDYKFFTYLNGDFTIEKKGKIVFSSFNFYEALSEFNHLVSKLDDSWCNVSVSTGTMHVDDVFNSLVGFLPQSLIDFYLGEETIEEKEMVLNEKIWEFMNEIAPKGYYFGSHPGDGSDFGFWEEDSF